MDIIKEEPNLEEGRTQAPPMKEEQLVDIKYEEHSDPVSRKVILSPEMVSSALILFLLNLDVHWVAHVAIIQK
jgi:hypothetical protein